MAILQPYDHVLLNQRSVTLTDAQIRDLPNTPQIIIDAPGVNRLIIPQAVYLFAHFPTPYDVTAILNSDYLAVGFVVGDSGTNVSLLYQTSVNPWFSLLFSNAWGATDHKTQLLVPESKYDTTVLSNLTWGFQQPIESWRNHALLVYIEGDGVTGGSAENTLTISVLYTVYDATTHQFV